MSEIAPAGGGGPNRLFVILALGLAALLVLGLIAIGGVLLIPKIFTAGASPTPVRAASTVTRAIALATLAPSPTIAATDTAAPTPTLVNAGASGGSTPAAEGTATPTVIGASGGTPATTGTPGAGGELPSTGMGENLLLLAGGIVLVLIVFAARRARTA